MDILYSSDENYVKFAMVSIASLLENNQLAENITIYFIADELSEASKLQLESIVLLFNRKIEFIDAKNIDISFIRKTDFSPAGYYRLMIAEMIHSDKILYIDCDTVILGTLEELWSIDLEENLVAGVKDTVEDFMAVGVGLSNNSGYINSGVMLYNLKKMREINFTNQ